MLVRDAARTQQNSSPAMPYGHRKMLEQVWKCLDLLSLLHNPPIKLSLSLYIYIYKDKVPLLNIPDLLYPTRGKMMGILGCLSTYVSQKPLNY